VTALLLALLVQDDLGERVRRALDEPDRAERAARIAELRAVDPRKVEEALRALRRAVPTLELGRIVERTSKSELDQEAFGYAVHVPAGYEPSRPWPVLVTLHGANVAGDPKAGARWIRVWLESPGVAERMILLAPTTVRHTWASRAGHAYVLTALGELGSELSIDPDRIYLDGMSMGAGGAFRLAEHYPDRWAAIGPRCNFPEMRLNKDKTYQTLYPENYRHLPVYWVVGAKDERIPIDLCRAGRDAIQAAGGELVYREFPEGGHDWGLEKDAAVLDWYEHHRRTPYPEEVLFRNHEKIFPRAYWVEILKRTEAHSLVTVHMDMKNGESERRTEYYPPALVRARRSGNTLTVTCEEVKELRLFLDDALVDLDKPVLIVVNGKKLHDAPVKRSVEVLLEEAHRRRDTSMTFTALVDLKPR
jgi:predicted esterase